MREIPYALLCALLGLALGWLPMLVHGPIPARFDRLYIDGSLAVWAFYTARLSIGLLVGITRSPAAWYLRGPLCGLLALFPLTVLLLAVPGCGGPCMFWNLVTAAIVGTTVAGIARVVTGLQHG